MVDQKWNLAIVTNETVANDPIWSMTEIFIHNTKTRSVPTSSCWFTFLLHQFSFPRASSNHQIMAQPVSFVWGWHAFLSRSRQSLNTMIAPATINRKFQFTQVTGAIQTTLLYFAWIKIAVWLNKRGWCDELCAAKQIVSFALSNSLNSCEH